MVIPENLRAEFPTGYFVFLGDLPRDRVTAEEALSKLGFERISPDDAVETLLDGEVSIKFPEAEAIVQVGENGHVGYGYLVHPLINERDKVDYLEAALPGGSRAEDIFMVRNRPPTSNVKA